MDGAGLILGHGEDGAADEGFQGVLGDADAAALAHIGQVGVIVGVFGGDGEGCEAGADGHLVGLVHHHGDRALGQPADDVAEELGGEDADAGIGDFRGDLIGDGGFHVVAGEAQHMTGPAEDALDDGEAGLLSHGAGGDIQSLNQHAFFTGKTHRQTPSLFLMKKIYKQISYL